MGEIVTQANFVPSEGMLLDIEDMVERDCYRTTEEMINQFIMAGERLEEYRRDQYDLDGDSDVVELPINRNVNFDMAEASMILNAEEKRINEKKNEESKTEVISKMEDVKKAENGSA